MDPCDKPISWKSCQDAAKNEEHGDNQPAEPNDRETLSDAADPLNADPLNGDPLKTDHWDNLENNNKLQSLIPCDATITSQVTSQTDNASGDSQQRPDQSHTSQNPHLNAKAIKGNAMSDSDLPRCDQEREDEEDGRTLSLNVRPNPPSPCSFFLPLHYTASYPYPVVVWFHNDGFNEHQIDQIMPHLSLRNYIGIGIRGSRAADSAGHCFSWHDSPAAIGAANDAVCNALDEADRRFSIHPSRIILAGYQSGGTMAQRIAFRSPNDFAGVVSLGGRIPKRGFTMFKELRSRKLPLLWQWSTQNPSHTEQNLKADCQLAMSISANVEIRQYSDDDEMNTTTLRDANEWMMRQLLPDSCVSDSQQWSTQAVAYSNN